MKRLQFLAALSAALTMGGAAEARGPATAKAPVVVELFTAQGCTACPQANALLGELASKKGVIALTFPVDYWDYLGWADTFARPEYTARQRAYIGKLKLREIYTPEVIVNGRREARGFDRAKVGELVTDALAKRRAPLKAVAVKDAQGRPTRVSVGAGPSTGAAEVWLVRYDPAERTVKVTTGDNKGKTVVQENVVRELVRLGSWSGAAKRLRVPPPAKTSDPAESALKSVLLVQCAKGGPLIGAAAL
ncbi:thioredoxin family protein [soil metagenome]